MTRSNSFLRNIGGLGAVTREFSKLDRTPEDWVEWLRGLPGRLLPHHPKGAKVPTIFNLKRRFVVLKVPRVSGVRIATPAWPSRRHHITIIPTKTGH